MIKADTILARLGAALPPELKKDLQGIVDALRLSEELCAALRDRVASEQKLSTGLDEQIKLQEKLLEACVLTDGIKNKVIEEKNHLIEALNQVEIHGRALMQSAMTYAIESRAILIYTLERVPRGDDWPRLWEALPAERKDDYFTEATEWFKKQPDRIDPALRAQMKPVPSNGKVHESGQNTPGSRSESEGSK